MTDWNAEAYSEPLKPCPSCGKDMIRAGYLTLEGQRSWQYLPLECRCFTSVSESEAKPGVLKLDHIACMDNMEYLCSLPDDSVDCVVTSPSFYGLRDYGTATWEGGEPNCKHSFGNQVQDSKNPGAITSGVRPGVDASKCLKCGAIRIDKQIGLEPTPQEYVARLVALFREVHRVLKPSGVVFLNLGDSFASDDKWGGVTSGKHAKALHGTKLGTSRDKRKTGLGRKNLIGIPWRVALALQDDGWILRADIIWEKPNALPESVLDRPSRSHEYVFMLVKSPKYWCDMEAIKEPVKESSIMRITQPNFANQTGGEKDYGKTGVNTSRSMRKTIENLAIKHDDGNTVLTRNPRTVWSVCTEPYKGNHFATFPTKLIAPMILCGCPDKVCSNCGKPWVRVYERTGHVNKREAAHTPNSGPTKTDSTDWAPVKRATGEFRPACKCNAPHQPGIVLEPFAGSGTTCLVARNLGRHFIACDLNPSYVAEARERLRQPFEAHHIQKETDLHDLPLFQGVGD